MSRLAAKLILPLILILVAGGLLAGCASTPKIDWNSRVGTYTFDQAVAEFGPPDKSTTLKDGSSVAEWRTGTAPQTSVGFGVGSYGGHSGVSVGTSVGSGYRGRYLRLNFAPDGTLTAWQGVTR
jgi:hypothetical protein